MKLSLYDRIMDNVSFAPQGCMLWTGNLDNGGYGHISINNVTQLVHRVMYKLKIGPIPDGKELDHLCRVRCCVNPQHLEPVTRAENLRRSPLVGKNRYNAKKTHCKRGHEFNLSNTYIDSRKRRCCRECQTLRREGKI